MLLFTLQNGCATIYPPNGGIPRIKQAASDFVKAFIGVDVSPEGCVPTTGSMQGTFATFMAIHHAFAGTACFGAQREKEQKIRRLSYV